MKFNMHGFGTKGFGRIMCNYNNSYSFFPVRWRNFRKWLTRATLPVLPNKDQIRHCRFQTTCLSSAKSAKRLPAKQNTLKFSTTHVISCLIIKKISTTLLLKTLQNLIPNTCREVSTKLEKRIVEIASKIGAIEQKTSLENFR